MKFIEYFKITHALFSFWEEFINSLIYKWIEMSGA